jgi:hypothetical protein
VPTVSVLPPAHSAGAQDLDAAVAMRLRAVTEGATDQDWAMASDPRIAAPFLASALRRGVLNMLGDLCTQHRLRLVSVEPVFAAVWNHVCGALAPGQWLAICQGAVLTLCIAPATHLQALRRLDFTAAQAQDAGWLAAAVRHESLRLGLPVPAVLAVCGEPPPAWTEADGRRLLALRLVGKACDALGLWGLRP